MKDKYVNPKRCQKMFLKSFSPSSIIYIHRAFDSNTDKNKWDVSGGLSSGWVHTEFWKVTDAATSPIEVADHIPAG